jgi:hypothetical protein
MPHLFADFTTAATIFNDVSYGERPGSEAGYRHIAQLDDRLQHHERSQHLPPDSATPVDEWTALR